jgi:3-deoxy-manno-octulosonate cytidylyltransferase (CMP-KDO synthetase)
MKVVKFIRPSPIQREEEYHMIIIPARIGSTRFPSKVMADVLGVPMFARTAMAVSDVDDVVVATDSEEVSERAKELGIESILTSADHTSGTERIYEAATKLGLDDREIVINVQADEPFIEAEVVEAVYNTTAKHSDDHDVIACSAYKSISNPEADDPNIVKVVTDDNGFALYFSRSKIPFPRDHHFDGYKGHLGIYGFTMKSLSLYSEMKPCDLEHIEKLEQLRVLAHGYKIAMCEVETDSFGIDTIEDLQRAIRKHTL